MAQSKHTGRPSALLAKSGLVAAFLAGTSAGMVAQNAHADGIVRCWGYNNYGQCNTPADLGPCSSIEAGNFHTIALRSDGGVRCWGNNVVGECNTPADLGPCSSIAGGGYHTIALRSDGSVRCWGAGLTNTGSASNYGQCYTPVDLSPCSSVAGGGGHTIAIEAACPQCPSSLTGNCIVNGADLGLLLNAWGSCPAGITGCTGDINADGQVNGADLGYLLNAWGPCTN
jgi:hypothetical protein